MDLLAGIVIPSKNCFNRRLKLKFCLALFWHFITMNDKKIQILSQAPVNAFVTFAKTFFLCG